MICKNCGNKFDGKYSKWTSGEFCSRKCARGFSSKEKRQEINLKVSIKLRQYEIKPCEWCGKSPEKRYGTGRFCSLNCKQSFAASKNFKRANSFKRKDVLEKTHATQQRQREEKYAIMQFKDLPTSERRRRILVKFESKCNCCGLSEWQNKLIPLEIHHINGDNSDNREENLALLCPNCHSITDNFRNKNKIKKEVPDDTLLQALRQYPRISQALKVVGLTPKAGNYARCRNLLATV